MTEHFPEENTIGFDQARQRILNTQNIIDSLHQSGGAKENGAGVMEFFRVFSDSDLIFIEKGGQILGLKDQEAKKFEELCRAWSNGELNDEGREEDLRQLAILRVKFDKIYEDEKGKRSQA